MDPEWQDFMEDIIETVAFEKETIKLNLAQEDIIPQIISHHKKIGIDISESAYINNFNKAICTNTFSIIKENKDKIVESSPFDEAIFDKQLNTGIGQTSPDFFLSNDKVIIGIVSKFTEMLETKSPNHENYLQNFIDRKELEYLPKGYDKFLDYYMNLRENLFLDISQLIELSVGLLNYKNSKKAGILYIYWTPSNYHNIPIYEKHFSEVESFKSKMNSFLSFRAISYDKFWSFYQEDVNFQEQFTSLKNIYNIELQAV